MSERARDKPYNQKKKRKRSNVQILKRMKCAKTVDLEHDLREYFIRVLIRGDQEFDSLEDKSKCVSNKRISLEWES